MGVYASSEITTTPLGGNTSTALVTEVSCRDDQTVTRLNCRFNSLDEAREVNPAGLTQNLRAAVAESGGTRPCGELRETTPLAQETQGQGQT